MFLKSPAGNWVGYFCMIIFHFFFLVLVHMYAGVPENVASAMHFSYSSTCTQHVRSLLKGLFQGEDFQALFQSWHFNGKECSSVFNIRSLWLISMLIKWGELVQWRRRARVLLLLMLLSRFLTCLHMHTQLVCPYVAKQRLQSAEI